MIFIENPSVREEDEEPTEHSASDGDTPFVIFIKKPSLHDVAEVPTEHRWRHLVCDIFRKTVFA